MSNPFFTYAGLQGRSPHVVHLGWQNDPIVLGYQVWGHRTVNDAYGNPVGSGVLGAGPVAMFQVDRDGAFRSPTLRRRKTGQIIGSTRGQTHAAFDPEDYVAALPPDNQWMFLRTQENRIGTGLLTIAGADPCLGPIYCTPPAEFFGMRRPVFTLQGTAPSATFCIRKYPPVWNEDLSVTDPRPMYLVFPRQLTEFTLRNLGADPIVVALDPLQLMRMVSPGESFVLTSGSATVKGIVLASNGAAGTAFSLNAVSASEM